MAAAAAAAALAAPPASAALAAPPASVALAAPPASAISTHSNSNRPTSFRTRRTTIPSLPTSASRPFHPRRLPPPCQAAPEADDVDSSSSPPADEATQKYGLEFGLWKIFSSKDGEGKEKSKTEQAKELLAKYGGAYLATSITLSLISFSLCYALVSAGIDVQTLLEKVGVSVDETGEKVGTFALAYAAHKAASPIRFPPTVALTPIVASWIGKKVKDESK